MIKDMEIKVRLKIREIYIFMPIAVDFLSRFMYYIDKIQG